MERDPDLPRRSALADTREHGGLGSPGERARTLAVFYLLGGMVGLGSITVGAWPSADLVAMAVVDCVALGTGITVWIAGQRVPRPLLSVALAAGTLMIATVQLASGAPSAAGAYGIVYILCVIYAVLFLGTIDMVLQVCLVIAAQIVTLDRLGSFEPADTRGLAAHVFVNIVVSLGVAGVMAHHLRRRRWAERDVEAQSRTDSLTGLANRAALVERLDAATTHHTGSSALLLIDISAFGDVNETFGADVGDHLLRVVGRRLAAAVRQRDLVARIGGDEFAVLLMTEPGAHAGQFARQTADRLLAAVSEPFEVEGIALAVEARTGIAVTTAGASSLDLLRQADLAVDQARYDSRSVATVTRVPPRRSPDRLALLADVRRSLVSTPDERSGILIPFFQPVVAVDSGQIVGAEALVRWLHPTRGLMAPAAFLPLVERTSLIRELTSHMLTGALQACASWRAAGMALSVSVNVSARDLGDPGLVETIAAGIAEAGVPASALTVEITETALMNDVTQASGVVAQLRTLGTGVSVDDFGTGWSSLTHLQRLPVTELKVDRSFVTDALANSEAATIVAATIGLGQALGLSVVAEGVEDAATFGWLADLGCDLAQGWHFGRPMPEGDFTALGLAAAKVQRPTGAAPHTSSGPPAMPPTGAGREGAPAHR